MYARRTRDFDLHAPYFEQLLLVESQDGEGPLVPQLPVAFALLVVGGGIGVELLAQPLALGVVRRPSLGTGNDVNGFVV